MSKIEDEKRASPTAVAQMAGSAFETGTDALQQKGYGSTDTSVVMVSPLWSNYLAEV